VTRLHRFELKTVVGDVPTFEIVSADPLPRTPTRSPDSGDSGGGGVGGFLSDLIESLTGYPPIPDELLDFPGLSRFPKKARGE